MRINKPMASLLQACVVLVAIGAMALLLWEPHLEGRNAHATVYQVYFNDPFLAYAYFASIPFFVALHQAYRMLAGLGRGIAPETSGFRRIRHCAIAIIGLVFIGELFVIFSDSDDRSGGFAIGMLIAVGAATVAILAKKFERHYAKQ